MTIGVAEETAGFSSAVERRCNELGTVVLEYSVRFAAVVDANGKGVAHTVRVGGR